ncbi:MAG: hypothetical protein QM651_01110 [Rhodoblastus sp.]
MSASIRRRAGFTKHVKASFREINPAAANNVIIPRSEKYPFWVADVTGQIGDWRGYIRDVYLRWAITINAMHLAVDHWKTRPKETALQTVSLRAGKDGNAAFVPVAEWPAPNAVENYQKATPLLAAYGVTDLFGALEEIIFEMYETFLNDQPEHLMKGEEFRELRRLYKGRDDGEEAQRAWESVWIDRLDKWRRKRLYDGLHSVLKSFFHLTGLQRPSSFKHTDVDDWCRAIEAIGELRNCVTHGMGTVSQKLADLTATLPTDVFRFTEGDALNVELRHLMFVECFVDQLLSAINAACCEMAKRQLTGKA